MPPVGAALAAITIADVAIFIGKALLSMAISAVFQKKPSAILPAAPNIADLSQTLTTLEPAAAWEVVYGRNQKGGKLVFRHVTDTVGSAQAPVVNAVIPHTSPYTITLPDAAEFVSNVSVVQSLWVGGEDNYQDTLLTAVGGSPAQGEYSVAAGVYTFNAADAGKAVYITYTKRNVDSAHNRLHLVIVWAAHECAEIETVYFNDEAVPLDGGGNATGKYANHALVKHHLGAADQDADSTLIAEAPDKWTSAHRLRGHCYTYIRLLRNRDLFPNGVPNIKVLLKGKKLYDSRDATTAYKSNAALAIADYLSNGTYGLGGTYGTDIDTTFLNAAANICDEDVALKAGGTEDRYTCNGVVNTAESPQEILERMLTSLAGRLVYIGGAWRLRAGAYVTPTVTLDEGDARGPMRVKTLRRGDELFNRVKGVFVSPDNHWQPADFPAVTSATYLAQDSNIPKWENIDLPFTTSGATAQRIAKLLLERVRRQVNVAYAAKMTAYRVEPPEPLMLTNAKHGYSSKVFETLELGLALEEDDQGHPVFGVNLQLQEIDSSVFSWTGSAEETVIEAAPTTTLPDPRQVAPPGIPSVTEELYETSGSAGLKSKATVTWAPAPDGKAWRYEHEYKLKSAVNWTPSDGLINGTYDEAFDLPAGRYQSRVRAVSSLGVRSAWSQVEYEIIGLTAAPTNVSGFAVQSYADQAKFVWTKAADLDVLIGGRVMVRWTPLTSGVDWNDGTLVNPDGYPGDTTIGFGPLMTGTYFAKFQDSEGNLSVTEASFVVTEALLRDLTSLGFVDFHSTFAGAKTNLVVTDSKLQLTAETLWDDIPGNIDDWGLVDYVGGIEQSGTVTFDDKLDLGSVTRARLFTHLESEGFSTADLWDARTTLMDSWGTVDGDVIEDADVTIMVRATDDDPAGGSPSWGPWHPLGLVADYLNRGFEFRADFTSADPTHNRRISELTITAKEA